MCVTVRCQEPVVLRAAVDSGRAVCYDQRCRQTFTVRSVCARPCLLAAAPVHSGTSQAGGTAQRYKHASHCALCLKACPCLLPRCTAGPRLSGSPDRGAVKRAFLWRRGMHSLPSKASKRVCHDALARSLPDVAAERAVPAVSGPWALPSGGAFRAAPCAASKAPRSDSRVSARCRTGGGTAHRWQLACRRALLLACSS